MNLIVRQTLRFIFWVSSFFVRLYHYRLRQKLKSQNHPDLNVSPQGYDAQEERLRLIFQQMPSHKTWAKTSGTTHAPKLIPYDQKRLSLVQNHFLLSMITLTSPYQGLKTFFVFASINQDDSLTAGLISEGRSPTYVELLQAPYRYLSTEKGQRLIKNYGIITARLAILTVTCPRFIYATNPSTIGHFIEELFLKWEQIREDLTHLLNQEADLKPLLKMAHGNGKKRLFELSKKAHPDVEEIFPGLTGVITWDGGYVKPFLDRLKSLIPSSITFIPMYSMCTEGIETLPHFINNKIVFLPTLPKAYPEFLNNDGKIFLARELKLGEEYTLILTDQWGLLRYDTQDIFKVHSIVDQLPDLRFMRRREVTASMTGEKITESQILEIYSKLREEFPDLKLSSLSLVPTVKSHNFYYTLYVIGPENHDPALINSRAQELLGSINSEYADKVASGRLKEMSTAYLSTQEFAKLMGQENTWESQFKFLPLYAKPHITN